MTFALRLAAVVIAVAGLVDPAIARRTRAPLAVEFRLPPASDPQYALAVALRTALVRQLERDAVIDGSLAPQAVIAIGNANIDGQDSARVFAVPVTVPGPQTTILAFTAPRRTMTAQRVDLMASIIGNGVAGRTSSIALEVRGSVLQTTRHTWRADGERFDGRLTFVPPAAGVYRARVRVSTDEVRDLSIADTMIVASDAPVRVLAYEPRPSWPVTFVRRALESDTFFDVASTAATSRPSATVSGDTPKSLSDVDVDRYDVLIVGALDDLRNGDLEALDRFANRRGGTLLLLPDRQVPGAVQRYFDLPRLDEVLVEKPLGVQAGSFSLQASELLLAPASEQSIATVHQAGRPRTAIVTVDRGEGRVILSGALDAWRYRASSGDGFGSFWRALVTDTGLAAPPKLQVTVDRAIARPGEDVNVSIGVRPTELDRRGDRWFMPTVSASLIDPAGKTQIVRLWPAARVGGLIGRVRAVHRGRHTLTASMTGASTTIPLLIEDDVTRPAADAGAANAYAAVATGGAVARDPDEVVRLAKKIDTGVEERTTYPMRSWWWMLPFTGLLCVEWTVRRRSGLK